MNSGRMQDSRSELIDAQHGGNVNRTVIEISERTLSVIAIVVATAAAMVTLMLYSVSERDTEHLYKRVDELRIRLEDQQVALQIAGVIKPGDAITGPGANTDRLKPK